MKINSLRNGVRHFYGLVESFVLIGKVLYRFVRGGICRYPFLDGSEMRVAGNYAEPDWMFLTGNWICLNSSMDKADLKYKNRCVQDRARASGMRYLLDSSFAVFGLIVWKAGSFTARHCATA
ncbi:hypothetical protein [Burkholderia cepacia]|uniref:hypothetical protein n=1 Tax=Burkholderia cepacia TaxID=292 RepID=UPI0012D894F0|nr:hypothetical protein [Burkholderia cepacia]